MAAWAGDSDEIPQEPLDAAILFAPVGAPVRSALRAICKGGRVVCAGIHMSDILSVPHRPLWEACGVGPVADPTRSDGHEFFAPAQEIDIRTETAAYPLERAGTALDDPRHGRFEGAAVPVV